MTVAELHEYMAFYALDPFGSYRTDLNTAFVCKMLASADAKVSDFMPFEKPKKKDLAKELMEYFTMKAEQK